MKIEEMPRTVYRAVYQQLGGSLANQPPDTRIWEQMEEMSPRELFDSFLSWEGIIGYTDMIIDVVIGLNIMKYKSVSNLG